MQTVKVNLPLDIESSENSPAFLKGFIHEPNPEINRKYYPVMVVVPGCSYTHIPFHQAETLALAFYNQGYQAFYLRYHFTTEFTPLLPVPIIDLGHAIKLIRRNAETWFIQTEKIAISGFSAGGQIVALFNGLWTKNWLLEKTKAKKKDLKPNAILLGYPVIDLSLGWPKSVKELDEIASASSGFSAENFVNQESAPVFLWVTNDDPVVPVINSLAYMNALNKEHISGEFHIYAHGPHGLALADKQTAWQSAADIPHVATWFNLAIDWLNLQLTISSN